MDRKKTVASLIAALVLGGCSHSSDRPIRIGSKNFTEQVVLGEIIAQHVEHRLQQKVERSLNLGGTLLAHQALVSGQIDLYPEYTGTALAVILKEPVNTESSAVLARVRSEYQRRFQLEWLDPLGIDNGFAIVVRGADARAHGLETLSDASQRGPGWILGVGYEFEQRADGMAALKSAYSLSLKAPAKTMDLGLLYKAVEQNQVNMIAANATDGLLSKLDLTVLRDNRHAFPPYEVGIAVRREALDRIGGLRAALDELSGKFTNEKMRELNYRVDGEHRSAAQVASEFLTEVGLR